MNTKPKLKLPKGLRLLGDPHLGKTFTKGVPLDRRGHREEMVQTDFINSYLTGDFQLHVCVGDLFDKFRVPEEVILFAYKTVRQAAEQYPDRQFVILQGNHDASRDLSLVSSFQVFKELCEPFKNVFVISVIENFYAELGKDKFVFYPWMPFQSAEEVAEILSFGNQEDTYAIGHWDVKDFSDIDESHDNMIPYPLLDNCKGIITGHYHNACEFLAPETNVPVLVTGSMQPYSHSEDPEGNLYTTLTKDEVEAAISENPEAFANLNLRVLIEKGEPPLAEINCLSLNHKLKLSEEQVNLNVNIDTFSMESVFRDTFEEFGVNPELTENLWLLSQENQDAE